MGTAVVSGAFRIMDIAPKYITDIGRITFADTQPDNAVAKVCIISGTLKESREEKGIALLLPVSPVMSALLAKKSPDYFESDILADYIDKLAKIGFVEMLRHIMEQDCVYISDLADWVICHNYLRVEQGFVRCYFLCPPHGSPNAPATQKDKPWSVWATAQANDLLSKYNGVTTFLAVQAARDVPAK